MCRRELPEDLDSRPQMLLPLFESPGLRFDDAESEADRC